MVNDEELQWLWIYEGYFIKASEGKNKRVLEILQLLC